MADVEKLVSLIAKLRSDEGCPWDRKQTLESMAPFLTEETREAVDEIEKGDAEALCEELGDVMLIVVMMSRIAEEAGLFDFGDVTAGICDKIVRRHPHVFGGAKFDTAEEVIASWKKIKQAEKLARERK